MLWGVGIPASAGNSGLDVYREAMKHTKAETSMTAHVQVEVTDSGKRLATLSGEAKIDRDRQEMSAAGTLEDWVGGKSRSFEAYREDGSVIVKKGDSDVYQLIETGGWQKKREDAPAAPPVIVEHVHDMMLGHFRDLSRVESLPDGSKEVDLQLTEEELPFFANKIAEKFFAKVAKEKQPGESDIHNVPLQLPKLKQDIEVEQVALQAKIDRDNRIAGQSAEIHVAGTDERGQKHELVVKVDVSLSDFSQTQPVHFDPAGKQVERVRGWRHPAEK